MIKTRVLALFVVAGMLGGCNQSLSDGQTGAIVGIVAGGVVVLGGLVFVLTMRPRRTAGRLAMPSAQRRTFVYSLTLRTSAAP